MKVNDASQSQRMVWTPDNFVLSEVSKGDFVGHPFRGNQWTVGGVKDVVGPRSADEIVTRADLIKFAEMPPAFVGDTELFTHATKSRADRESIMVEGIKPKYESGTVYASRPPLVRDLGVGYVIFKADKGVAVEGKDIVEIGLSYDEYKFNKTIRPSDIVKVVGTYVFNDGGQNIREDYLADFILKNPDDPQIDALPEKYKRWARLASDVSKGDYVGHPFRGNQWTDASGISRGGATSTPDEDRRAYELRQAGKSWEDIARELGYANGGSVRRLAMRHEARLKQNLDPTLVIPPLVAPDKTADETNTKLSDLADPSSIRAARRLLKEILPDGAVATLQKMSQASGGSNAMTTEELKFIAQFEEAGKMLAKAIDAQTEMDLNGGTKEQVAERAETIKNLEIITRSMWLDNQRLRDLALERISKVLQGTTVDSEKNWVSKISAASVDEAVALTTAAFKEFGSDDTTAAHQLIQSGGDLDMEIEFSRDSTDPLRLINLQETSSIRIINNIDTSGSLPRERASMMSRSTLFMTADAMRVTSFSKEIVHKLVQDLTRGKLTLTEVLNLTPDQILDRNQQTYTQFRGGESVLTRRDSLRGVEQRVDDDGNPLGPVQPRQDPFDGEKFAVLGVNARTKVVVDQVQRLLRDPQILKTLQFQAENVSKKPFKVNLKSSGVDEVKEIAAGATVREIEEFLDVARGETNSVTRSEARVKAAVKVLEASGVKFSNPKDVPHTIASARGSSIKPQVEKDYMDTMDAAISFLPRSLTDGSQEGSMQSRFQGGGPLNVVAMAGSGVRRAHAENGGNGRVIVSQPRPARRTDGVMSTADRSVMLHEIGHGVEYANPWVRYVEWMTWKDRAGSEKPKGLASITGNKGYRSHEKGVKDAWENKYAGKTYGGENPSRSQTFEILTTGLQSVFFGDERIDEQHLAVVLGILAASSVTK